MKRRLLFTALLAIFMTAGYGLSTFFGTVSGISRGISVADAVENKPDAPKGVENQQKKGHQVIAYYFHTTFRCTTCFTIEQYTRDAILSGFPEELKDGRLVWKVVNVDDEGNEHFTKDYELSTKSVVIVDMNAGTQVRWKNLEDIWKLADNKNAFKKYIQEETRSYLKEKRGHS
jgi:hypothetical protein